MSSATHIIVTPDFNGYGFVSTIEENGTTITRGHRFSRELAEYCKWHNLPVVVEGEVPAWVSQTTSRLQRNGVTVYSSEEALRLALLDAYWLRRCEVGDRIEFKAHGHHLWGKVVAKGGKYLDVMPDGWMGSTYVAGREVLTLTTKGPQR